jgi:hypothetical protein
MTEKKSGIGGLSVSSSEPEPLDFPVGVLSALSHALQRVNPVSYLVLVLLFQGGFDTSGRRCFGANVRCERPS